MHVNDISRKARESKTHDDDILAKKLATNLTSARRGFRWRNAFASRNSASILAETSRDDRFAGGCRARPRDRVGTRFPETILESDPKRLRSIASCSPGYELDRVLFLFLFLSRLECYLLKS